MNVVEARLERDSLRFRAVPADDMGELFACWREYFASHPHVHGWVKLRFTILPNGTTSEPRVRSANVGDAALLACVTNYLRGVVIDDPPGAKQAAAWSLLVDYDAPPSDGGL